MWNEQTDSLQGAKPLAVLRCQQAPSPTSREGILISVYRVHLVNNRMAINHSFVLFCVFSTASKL